MCLITKQKKPIILEQDIIVYKKMMCIVVGYASSVYHAFEYKIGKLYTTTITNSQRGRYADATTSDFYEEYFISIEDSEIKFDEKVIVYNEGFHFYTTKERANKSRNGELWECIIPAGSEVYYDETGLGVTNQIIINKLIE